MSGTSDLKPDYASQHEPLPEYTPPRSGLLAHIPASWVPFGELSRIDKPTGIYLFFFPHLFGTLYETACNPKWVYTPSHLLHKNAILLVGTIFFRAAACAWNDNMDCEYDRQVLRCRLRPIARRAITPSQGHLFTALMTVLALLCLYVLPKVCWAISVPSIAILVLYPFAKRFTDYPQVILGVQVSMGLFMGMGAINPTLFEDLERMFTNKDEEKVLAIVSLYMANICWTIVYDTVYAQQDIEDDARAGVRSMAVRFQGSTRTLLYVVSLLQVTLLVACGYWQDFGRGYMVMACGGTITSLGVMNTTIDISKPSECLWWFKNGCWFVGLSMSLGLCLEGLGLR
ncbi:UbiA prenyltransferase family-domain-containing protein [Hypoxylon rubiginosum]|uniref:UbiA prenyltransferase family-domain-containing protein n=1 Tax=Hypoxylon rubiginosum TaxID=110542 RepID=A0ACC0CJR4_9PEZI|nr:UbiA prenyltransferase family-domain-containing protein [Hypoxylon rubiginosum]